MGTQNKQIIDLVKQVAEQMPVVLTNSCEVHMVKGVELIEQGHTHEEIDKGKLIDPERVYVQKMPVQIAVNHKRRMLRAYANGGQVAVLEYIAGVKKLMIDSQPKSSTDGKQKQKQKQKRKRFKLW